MAVRDSGSTLARISLHHKANPDYIARKKLLVWCFGACEYSEGGGWRKTPVVK
jgi:hypothetical protein